MQFTALAFSLAFPSAGRSIAAKIPMIAITTKSSISVKFFLIFLIDSFLILFISINRIKNMIKQNIISNLLLLHKKHNSIEKDHITITNTGTGSLNFCVRRNCYFDLPQFVLHYNLNNENGYQKYENQYITKPANELKDESDSEYIAFVNENNDYPAYAQKYYWLNKKIISGQILSIQPRTDIEDIWKYAERI